MQLQPTPPLNYKRARFSTTLPSGYLYTPGHFWLASEDQQTWRVGLTKFASRMLGEMVDHGFEMGDGDPVSSGQVVGWIEGFKAVSELFCPAEGVFAGGNPELEKDITLVNGDVYGAGWLYSVRGRPDQTCVDVHGYTAILDQTIDKLQQER